VIIPQVSAALPKRLGSFPFWRSEARFLDKMEIIYSQASPIGLRVFLGEQTDSPLPNAEERGVKRKPLLGDEPLWQS